MNVISSPRIFCSISFALVLLAGCGNIGNVPVYPVSGTVNFNGKPMEGGGSIAFIPKGKRKGKAAGGTINMDGTYTLSTYKDGDGSMVGEFKVVVTQETTIEPTATKDGETPAPKPKPEVPTDGRIPAMYADPQSTELEAKVEAKKNSINFDLKPQAPVQRGGA